MSKKDKKSNYGYGASSDSAPVATSYNILNLTESVLPVPYFDENGVRKNLHLRARGKGAGPAPTLKEAQIGQELKDLEKKKLVKISKA